MSAPAHVLVGPTVHGVTRYAAEVADALAAPVHRVSALDEGSVRAATAAGRAHVHLTDALLGTGAAVGRSLAALTALTRAVPTTVTLHDVPQPTDGAARYARRRRVYRHLVAGMRAVACNSEHERRALVEAGVVDRAHVVPLPVLPPAAPPTLRPVPAAEIALLGYVYPGKGHAAVIDAVGSLTRVRRAPGVVALGRAAGGHDEDVRLLHERAHRLGVPFDVTGYLDDDELARRMDATAVPVAAHLNVSASGSINSWIARRRRPIVLDGRYTREMEVLRPGTLQLVDRAGLGDALGRALREPGSTWLAPTVSTRPHLADVVAGYRAWWARR